MREPKLTSTRPYQAPTFNSNAVPDAQIEFVADRSGEVTMGAFAEALKGFADQVMPHTVEAVEKEAARDAIHDVNAGKFEMRETFSVRGRKYNQAGLMATIGGLETDSMQRLRDLSIEHAGNAEAYTGAVTSYAAGLRSELVQLDPELALQFEQRVIARSQVYVEKLLSQQANQARDARDATLLRVDAQYRLALDDAAASLFAGSGDEAQAALASVNRLMGEALATMDGVDARGNPLYSEAAKEKARQAFFSSAVEKGAIAWLRNVDDLPTAALQLQTGDLKLMLGDGTEIDVSGSLDDAARARVMRAASVELQRRNTALADEERAQEKLVKEEQERTAVQITDMLILGSEAGAQLLTREQIIGLVDNGQLTGADGERFLLALEKRKNVPRETAPGLMDEALLILYGEGGDATDLVLNNLDRFSASDARSLLDKSRAMNAESDDDGLGAVGRRYLGFLRARLGVSGPLASLDPASSARAVAALDEYFQRVAIDGEDPIAVFNDVGNRAQQGQLLPSMTNPVPVPRGAVLDQAGVLDEAGTIAALRGMGLTDREFRFQAGLVRDYAEWQRANLGLNQ